MENNQIIRDNFIFILNLIKHSNKEEILEHLGKSSVLTECLECLRFNIDNIIADLTNGNSKPVCDLWYYIDFGCGEVAEPEEFYTELNEVIARITSDKELYKNVCELIGISNDNTAEVTMYKNIVAVSVYNPLVISNDAESLTIEQNGVCIYAPISHIEYDAIDNKYIYYITILNNIIDFNKELVINSTKLTPFIKDVCDVVYDFSVIKVILSNEYVMISFNGGIGYKDLHKSVIEHIFPKSNFFGDYILKHNILNPLSRNIELKYTPYKNDKIHEKYNFDKVNDEYLIDVGVYTYIKELINVKNKIKVRRIK